MCYAVSMEKPSSTTVGGLIGSVYFIVTILIASFFSADTEQATVIAQITNIHVTFLFVLLGMILPFQLLSNTVFQLIIGLLTNYAIGAFIGWIVGTFVWKKKVDENTMEVVS